MFPVMNVRDVRCPECGATRKAMDRALVLMCEYCGAFMGLDTGVETRLEIGRRAMEHLRNPTQASVRFNELAGSLQQAAQAGSRAEWKTIAQEYYALYAVLYPENLPATGRGAVRKWHGEAVATAELQAFEPEVKAAFDAYTAGLTGLYTAQDPVEAARTAFDRCINYYRVLSEHPSCPEGLFGTYTRHQALSTMQASLAGAVSVLGSDAIERIKKEVLGEKDGKGASACPECGAPLPAGERATCPFCGSMLIREAGDPWVSEQAALFKQVSETSPNFTPETAVLTALSFMTIVLQRERGMPIRRAVALLEKTVAWAPKDLICRQASLLFQSQYPVFLQGLWDGLAGWTPMGEPPSVQQALPAQASADAKWTEQLLQTWQTGGATMTFSSAQEEAMSLISHCLYPFFIRSALTVDHAMGFLKQVGRRCSMKDLAAAAELIATGYESNKQIHDFLAQLIARLR